VTAAGWLVPSPPWPTRITTSIEPAATTLRASRTEVKIDAAQLDAVSFLAR
jgi:hypothetical protein